MPFKISCDTVALLSLDGVDGGRLMSWGRNVNGQVRCRVIVLLYVATDCRSGVTHDSTRLR